jgi:hypothetical protein
MAEQSGRAELEVVIEKVSGHIGRLMSRWPMVETAIEQSVWTIRLHGFDEEYPERNEDKLEYIKAFLKESSVPQELRDRGLLLLAATKGVLKTRNIIAHSYISGINCRTTDVLFTRIWIRKPDADRAFGTKIEKRKIGELKRHAEQCVELSFELPFLPHALRKQLGRTDAYLN